MARQKEFDTTLSLLLVIISVQIVTQVLADVPNTQEGSGELSDIGGSWSGESHQSPLSDINGRPSGGSQQSPDSCDRLKISRLILKERSKRERKLTENKLQGQIKEMETAKMILEKQLSELRRQLQNLKAEWDVVIYTSDDPDAGTNGDVKFQWYGDKGSSKEYHFNAPDSDLFKPGQTDTFSFEMQNIGTPEKLAVGVTGMPVKKESWHLTKAVLSNRRTGGTYVFNFNQWIIANDAPALSLAAENGDKNPDEWEITVYTSDIPGAKSDAFIKFQLYGERGESREYCLDNIHVNDFQQGEMDTFSFEMADIGVLKTLAFRVVGLYGEADNWHISEAKVTNKNTSEYNIFKFNQWIVADGPTVEAVAEDFEGTESGSGAVLEGVVMSGLSKEENVALNALANQSSDYSPLFHGFPMRAVDGNTSPIYHDKSCTHTLKERNPWWMVELPEVYLIHSVEITNRGDCCAERLHDFTISMSTGVKGNGTTLSLPILCQHHQREALGSGVTKRYNCPIPVYAKYVKIQIQGVEFLTLCEVKVLGIKQANMANLLLKPEDKLDAVLAKTDIKERSEGSHVQKKTRSSLLQVEEDLALNAVAKQSSDYCLPVHGFPMRAVDGNVSPNYHDKSCTHTRKERNPWWMVELQGVYLIHGVEITNRGDCCAERLHDFTISMSTGVKGDGTTLNLPILCQHNQRDSLGSGVTKRYNCPIPVYAKYVKIQIHGVEFLTLCEVKVLGIKQANTANLLLRPEDKLDALLAKTDIKQRSEGSHVQENTGPRLLQVEENLALNAIAKQSSDYSPPVHGFPMRAVDGNTSPNYHNKSCTHTRKERNPWWMVELSDQYLIRGVEITNRGDCCAERLHDFTISMSVGLMKDETTLTSPILCQHRQREALGSGVTTRYNCSIPVYAKYVKIQIQGVEFLTLCEVKVWGIKQANIANLVLKIEDNLDGLIAKSDTKQSPQKSHEPDNIGTRPLQDEENLVLNAVAKHSSDYSPHAHGFPMRAIDGNTSPNYHDKSCTHTLKERNPWWMVELPDVYLIRGMEITNRGDCCADRLHHFTISMSAGLMEDGMTLTSPILCQHHQQEALGSGVTKRYNCSIPVHAKYVKIQIQGIEFLTLCEVKVWGIKQSLLQP